MKPSRLSAEIDARRSLGCCTNTVELSAVSANVPAEAAWDFDRGMGCSALPPSRGGRPKLTDTAG